MNDEEYDNNQDIKMKMKRVSISISHIFIIILSAIFIISCKNYVQQKQYKIGILCGLDYLAHLEVGFTSKMIELGYHEGKNIVYFYHRTNFEPEKEQQILNQFIRDQVDLILTYPTEVSMVAKNVTQKTNTPVIFAVANIEETNLIESVQKPGGNLTGIRFPGPDLAVKRFEVLREIVPKAKKIWIPYQRGYPIIKSQMDVLNPVAKEAGITLIEFPADDAREVRSELERIRSLGDPDLDAILFIAEPLSCTDDTFEEICKFAYNYNIPLGGGLMQVGDYESIYGVDIDASQTGEQAAILADKILKGTPAGMIPVVSSESYLVINYKSAQKFGLIIPEGLLCRADKIIR